MPCDRYCYVYRRVSVTRLEYNRIKNFRFQRKNKHFSFLLYTCFIHQTPMHKSYIFMEFNSLLSSYRQHYLTWLFSTSWSRIYFKISHFFTTFRKYLYDFFFNSVKYNIYIIQLFLRNKSYQVFMQINSSLYLMNWNNLTFNIRRTISPWALLLNFNIEFHWTQCIHFIW